MTPVLQVFFCNYIFLISIIHTIEKIVKFLITCATEQLVHFFVTSRLDNYNSLLFGIPGKLIHRLQIIQYRAAD